MNKKIRTILFSILAISFLFIAPGTIFYAQGYRFDFEKMKFFQTGGIYVKVTPPQAKVFLNERFRDKTQLFSNALLIQNLLPEEYKIRIEKEGYFSWEKILEVQEKKVIDAKNIILFPQNLNFSLLKKEVKNFYILEGSNKIIIQTEDKQQKDLLLLDIDTKEESSLLKEANSLLENSDFVELIPSPSLERGLIKLENKNSRKIQYYLIFLKNKEGEAPFLLEFLDDKAKDIYFSPKDENRIFYQKENQVFQKEINSSDPPMLFLKDRVITFSVFENYLYCLREDGKLVKLNIQEGSSEIVTQKSFPFKKELNYKILILGNRLFLKEGNNLYLWGEEEKIFEKVFESVESIILSPLADKVLCATGHELWIFLLRDIQVPFLKQAGEKIFISRFSGEIRNPQWIENDYLIFSIGPDIKISEIDARSKLNVFNLAEFETPKISFCLKSKKLYVLSQDALFFSERVY